ncbi:hypothetical protein [Dactylosporangium sp. CA-139066]|uniref:hypothetical protein n=1 Tax=Dactylosporangium sp. CA-139066 TaxID=3239930 RepID=UPI003D8DEC58
MGDFLEAILEFPTVVFTFLLAVVIVYWLVVLFGVADHDSLDVVDVGLTGVPVTVGVSVLVLVAWFVSLAGATVVDGVLPGLIVLVAALVVAWLVARLLAVPLRRFFPPNTNDSRVAFVGRTCVIRTGTVTADFGQAEVHAADGSSAIVQVRQTGADKFAAGDTAVIYEYDHIGEFFWVIPTPGQRELS